jgi:hypothetical protein
MMNLHELTVIGVMLNDPSANKMLVVVPRIVEALKDPRIDEPVAKWIFDGVHQQRFIRRSPDGIYSVTEEGKTAYKASVDHHLSLFKELFAVRSAVS